MSSTRPTAPIVAAALLTAGSLVLFWASRQVAPGPRQPTAPGVSARRLLSATPAEGHSPGPAPDTGAARGFAWSAAAVALAVAGVAALVAALALAISQLLPRAFGAPDAAELAGDQPILTKGTEE